MNRGLFITFEGLDGSGKTTQIEAFIQHLEEVKIPYQLFREPGGTIIGEKIRQVLLDKNHSAMLPITELLLYSASRYQLTMNSIIPALEKGLVVICDRFYDSTTAYQGYGRGIDLNLIKQLNRAATASLVPDLTFILDIELDVRKKRLGKKVLDRLEQETIEFHKRVREGFIQMAHTEPERIVLIDGNRSADDIASEIWNHFNLLIKK
jgi:dTMP kinase